jgi:hypothetical protein
MAGDAPQTRNNTRVTMAVLGTKIDHLGEKIDGHAAQQDKLWTAHLQVHTDQEGRIRQLEACAHKEQPLAEKVSTLEKWQEGQKVEKSRPYKLPYRPQSPLRLLFLQRDRLPHSAMSILNRIRPSGRGKFVLPIGDTHGFSKTGLVPRGFRSSTGITLPLNFAQQYLDECWQHFKKQLPRRIDVLLPNGDLAEGQNIAEEARALSEVDPTFQARGVAALFEGIVEKVPWYREPIGDGLAYPGERHIYMQQGSTYHTGRGALIEEIIGGLVKARIGRDGRYCQPWRTNLLVEGVLFDIAHNQSIVSRYKSMPLDREIGYLLERIGRLWLKDGDGEFTPAEPPKKIVIIRSHAHYGFRVWREQNIIAVALPSWKLMDGYVGRSKMPNRMVPENIGTVGFWVKDGDVEIVDDYLYDHPREHWEVL